jgi:hypothetical protein
MKSLTWFSLCILEKNLLRLATKKEKEDYSFFLTRFALR